MQGLRHHRMQQPAQPHYVRYNVVNNNYTQSDVLCDDNHNEKLVEKLDRPLRKPREKVVDCIGVTMAKAIMSSLLYGGKAVLSRTTLSNQVVEAFEILFFATGVYYEGKRSWVYSTKRKDGK